MPKSPRNIDAARAAELVKALPPFVTAVGLFVNPAASEVESVLEHVRLDLLQFHGEEPPEFCAQFGTPYIKAVRVKAGVDLLQYAQRYRAARGLLLDAYVDGTHGGTGTAFDWSLIPRDLPLPVILSGGLESRQRCRGDTPLSRRGRSTSVRASKRVPASRTRKKSRHS